MRAASRLILCTALTLTLPCAKAEVKSSSPTGFALEQRIDVDVDAAHAWQALVHEVDAWWPRDHTWWGAESRLSIEPRAGGCFCEHAGTRSAEHLRVVFVDSPRSLRLLGGLGPLQGMGLHGVLEFRLSPNDDGGTAVQMNYTVGGYSATDLSGLAPVVDRVQAQQLGSLRSHLGGGEGEARRVSPPD